MEVTSALVEQTLELFEQDCSASPRVFFAPGRANLGGAHMDYNGGKVMPAALSRGTCIALSPRTDGLLRLRSAQFPGETAEVPIADLRPGRTKSWSAYSEGALYYAAQAWGDLPGLDIFVNADLPMGRGLSSSASVECGMVFAVSKLLEVDANVDEMIRLAHRAENEYVGVRCGILDQAAIFLAKADSILLFDCLELTREHLPFPSEKVAIAILDSGVQRELANSAFNERVAECTRALALLQEELPGVTCLRDVKRRDFEDQKDLLPPNLARRVEHVVSEFERTNIASRALRNGNLAGFGATLSSAHESLKTNYEVSTPELDTLVEAAQSVEGCLGSRLTGAGFGGCTVSVVSADRQEDFSAIVPEVYERKTGRKTKVDWFHPFSGPEEISL
ncbi:MAG: galactokinase [Planctomycetota bacterium]|nr:galactokinase [Planctomycetota bacterium]MDP7246225.1 galactokinase [Planctomycetota bacterium]